MNIDINMKNFIKKNLKLLTSKGTSQIQTIKRKKNEFWRKIEDEKIPKNPEISLGAIKYLIKTEALQSQKELDDLIEISDYIKKFLYIKDFNTLITDIFTEKTKENSVSYFSKEDLKKVREEDYKKNIRIMKKKHLHNEEERFWEDKTEILRKYGYDILINRFEPLLRKILINEVIILNYGLKDWQKRIPKGVIMAIEEEKEINMDSIDIGDFFDEIFFWGLKEIAIKSNHYKFLECLTGNLHKVKFNDLMDDLNELRKKIAHAKSSITGIDLNSIIFNVKTICQGDLGNELVVYINNEVYRSADDVPISFFDEYECPHNLPHENYDLVGGFVGRKIEIKRVKQLLYSDQDRIISITGAGGIGKTAVGIKLSYNILADRNNPFECILWFSAKESTLDSERGIVPIDSEIPSYKILLKDILTIVDNKTAEVFEKNKIEFDKYQEIIYEILSSQKCLIIIDNLETIKDENIIKFIKDIPRPSQVLITSRRGLREIERRYELPDFSERDAVTLFRLIAKARNKKDLLKLSDDTILQLVRKVKCYPLVIKWSLGKIFKGKDISEAFSAIYTGSSEIAKFVFDDVFSDLDENAKSILYSMVIYGDKPISRPILRHLANLDENIFEDVLWELIITSFIYPENIETSSGVTTTYCMLSLTRGFVSHKLSKNKKELSAIQSRYYELEVQIQEYEKSRTALHQSEITLGIKTDEEKIAFNYIKSGQRFLRSGNYDKAEKNFKRAIKTAPNFIYALIEYAKFEFEIGQIPESNTLYIKAIEVDPENWNSYYNYGVSLKRQNRIIKAIQNLEKALKLNPDYIKIYNNLGRVYTFHGDYEKANEIFAKIDKIEKYPNYKRRLITVRFQADNLLRWSESFLQRCDYDGGLDKLKQGLNIIKIAKLKLDVDIYILKLEKKINNVIGQNLCRMNNFDEALPYFEKNIGKIILRSGITISNDEERIKAIYYKAKYGYELKKIPIEDINNLIKQGLSISYQENDIRNFKKLKMSMDKLPNIPESEKKFGHIKYYNKQKKYGFIYSEGETYFFHIKYFYDYIDDKLALELEGKEVSFILIDNSEKKDEKMAALIQLESN